MSDTPGFLYTFTSEDNLRVAVLRKQGGFSRSEAFRLINREKRVSAKLLPKGKVLKSPAEIKKLAEQVRDLIEGEFRAVILANLNEYARRLQIIASDATDVLSDLTPRRNYSFFVGPSTVHEKREKWGLDPTTRKRIYGPAEQYGRPNKTLRQRPPLRTRSGHIADHWQVRLRSSAGPSSLADGLGTGKSQAKLFFSIENSHPDAEWLVDILENGRVIGTPINPRRLGGRLIFYSEKAGRVLRPESVRWVPNPYGENEGKPRRMIELTRLYIDRRLAGLRREILNTAIPKKG